MSTSSPKVTLDVLTVALLISAILYLFCLILAARKLARLHRNSPGVLSTKKLLVLSVGVACAIRVMSFGGVAALNIANVRAHYSMKPIDRGHVQHTPQGLTHVALHDLYDYNLDQYYQDNQDDNEDNGETNPSKNKNGSVQDKHQAFYDGAMTVLFDLPNCIVVSTYVLLTLVWAECFLQARFHTESTKTWQKRWLLGYTVFNALLYGTQTILYILIFALSASSSTHQMVRTALYANLTGINLVAVFLVLVLYLYLSVQFSGFPFRSAHLKQSFGQIASLMALWSITRILWGVAMLIVYIYNVELLQDSETPYYWSFFLLFLLFVVCEIIPIVAMLDSCFEAIVGFEANAAHEMDALAATGSVHAHYGDAAMMGDGGGMEFAGSSSGGARMLLQEYQLPQQQLQQQLHPPVTQDQPKLSSTATNDKDEDKAQRKARRKPRPTDRLTIPKIVRFQMDAGHEEGGMAGKDHSAIRSGPANENDSKESSLLHPLLQDDSFA